MSEQLELITEVEKPIANTVPTKALFITNHLNLMYMLAAGLVMPPIGFPKKYYADSLGTYPGWIPLFVDTPSREAIDLATSEAEYLRPTIVQFNLSSLSGPVMVMSAKGVEAREFRDGVSASERVILVPAPLPMSWVEFISFRTKEEKLACEADAKDYGNVPLADYPRFVNRHRPFTKPADEPWPLTGKSVENREVPLQHPLAAGGVMAMLQQVANLGSEAVHACRTAFDPDDRESGSENVHPILAGLGGWITTGDASLPQPLDTAQDRSALQNPSQAQIFWAAVDRLTAWRNDGQRGGAGDVLLDLLGTVAEDSDGRLQEGARKLRDSLASLSGLSDATPTELFERHETPLAHAMTLFFVNRDCAELLEYENSRLSELDWLAAVVLSGVRDGWMQLPLALRRDRAFSDTVCHRMAQMSHRLAKSGIELGDAPPRVRPLREMFEDHRNWKTREKSAALALAKAQKWDCVSTHIRLRAGEYKLTLGGGTLSIEVPGELRIAPEVDPDRFFELLAATRLDATVEANIRKLFGN